MRSVVLPQGILYFGDFSKMQFYYKVSKVNKANSV